jgi:hypothetical protein
MPRMRRNIDMTHGLVMSEAVMMGLGPYIGREYAHDLVYDICRDALRQKRPLIELLGEHPEIKQARDTRTAGLVLRPDEQPGPGWGDGRPGAGVDQGGRLAAHNGVAGVSASIASLPPWPGPVQPVPGGHLFPGQPASARLATWTNQFTPKGNTSSLKS